MTQQQPIAVTGATGFVGRHVVGELLARGHRVRALVRDARKAARVLGASEGLEVREVSSLSAEGLGTQARRLDPHSGKIRLDVRTKDANPLEGCLACVNCVGIIREAPGGQTFERVHVQVTEALVEACRAAGVTRFVQISALGVHPDGPSEYQKSKARAEAFIRVSDLDWTIIRPSLIHGEGSEFLEMASKWCRGKAAPWVVLPYFTRLAEHAVLHTESPRIAPVHVEDVARVVGCALESDAAVGEVYLVSGPEVLEWPEMLRMIRDAVPGGKRSMPVVGVPAVLAAGQARAARAIGLRDALPFDEGMALMAAQDSVADLTKVREHLGVEPRGFSASLGGYADRL